MSFFAHFEPGDATGAGREGGLASERMHRALFERNPQPIWLYDRSSLLIVAVNDAARLAYGYTRDEFLAMSITDLLPAEDIEEYLRVLAPLDSTATPDEPADDRFRTGVARRHRYKDGTIVDVELTYSDLLLDDRACRIVLSQNVTERNHAVAELASAHDEAVEASNIKSAFLANISHEIRTPMNGVLGMTELLLETALDEDQRALAIQVASSGKLMIEVITAILDISKIEAGQLDMDVTDFGLRETIERACAAAALQAKSRGVVLELRIADDVPEQARGDGRRVLQVLLNLLSNAVKFTSEGAVIVSAGVCAPEGGGDRVRIEIVDSGIGIEPSIIDRMFEPFAQADTSTRRSFGGTGLGLAIARELTELMGGTIGAESVLGHGSTFWIELPLAKPAGRRAPSVPAADADGAADALWAQAPLVLVVEDSQVNRTVAVRTLERCGCRADVADDGFAALAMLAGGQYDAVLMDCQMPECNGYEATAELRRREDNVHRTPVIAMTAHASAVDRERCLAAGMDDYISKPIRHDQLIEVLRRWVSPWQTRRLPAGARARTATPQRPGPPGTRFPADSSGPALRGMARR